MLKSVIPILHVSSSVAAEEFYKRLHREPVSKGVQILPGHPVDQTWKRREMYVTDLDFNTLRFGQ